MSSLVKESVREQVPGEGTWVWREGGKEGRKEKARWRGRKSLRERKREGGREEWRGRRKEGEG